MAQLVAQHGYELTHFAEVACPRAALVKNDPVEPTSENEAERRRNRVIPEKHLRFELTRVAQGCDNRLYALRKAQVQHRPRSFEVPWPELEATCRLKCSDRQSQ